MPWEYLAESSWLDVFQNALRGHWSCWDCVLQKAEEQLKCGISSGPVRVSAWNKTRERQNAPAVGDVKEKALPMPVNTRSQEGEKVPSWSLLELGSDCAREKDSLRSLLMETPGSLGEA